MLDNEDPKNNPFNILLQLPNEITSDILNLNTTML